MVCVSQKGQAIRALGIFHGSSPLQNLLQRAPRRLVVAPIPLVGTGIPFGQELLCPLLNQLHDELLVRRSANGPQDPAHVPTGIVVALVVLEPEEVAGCRLPQGSPTPGPLPRPADGGEVLTPHAVVAFYDAVVVR